MSRYPCVFVVGFGISRRRLPRGSSGKPGTGTDSPSTPLERTAERLSNIPGSTGWAKRNGLLWAVFKGEITMSSERGRPPKEIRTSEKLAKAVLENPSEARRIAIEVLSAAKVRDQQK